MTDIMTYVIILTIRKAIGSALESKPTALALNPLERNRVMQTVAQPTIKAKYALVYDEPARIAKVQGTLYVIYDDGRLVDFDVEMAPFTVVLGDVAMAETQAMWDRIAGGAARIACDRLQEVA